MSMGDSPCPWLVSAPKTDRQSLALGGLQGEGSPYGELLPAALRASGPVTPDPRLQGELASPMCTDV